MEIARLPTRIGNPMALELRPFQRRAVKALESGRYDTVVLSLPRAQGKSSLAAWIGFRALTPGDSLFESGAESHLVAASIGSARTTVFKILRRLVEDSDQAADYKVSESANACHVRHRQTNTRISVKAPSAKATLGLVGCPMVVVDEPGSYDLESGDSLWRALAWRVFGDSCWNATGTAAHFAADLADWKFITFAVSWMAVRRSTLRISAPFAGHATSESTRQAGRRTWRLGKS